MRTPPVGFVERLQRSFPGEDWVVRWNEVVSRWEFIGRSAAGRPVSQFWGWFYDPATGTPLDPDPITGLHPFRDLDPVAQDEAIRNLQRSFIGQTGDGAQDWELYMQARRDHNTALRKQRTKARAQLFADLLTAFDIRRPGWKKDHARPRRRKVA